MSEPTFAERQRETDPHDQPTVGGWGDAFDIMSSISRRAQANDIRRAAGQRRHARNHGAQVFQQTPGWMSGRNGKLEAPDPKRATNLTFEALHGEVHCWEGAVAPIDRGPLRFMLNDRDFEQETATAAWVHPGMEELAYGQESDRLHHWLERQAGMVGLIREVEPVMGGLHVHGILDDDYQLAHGPELDALLGHVARSGQVEAYGSAETDHSRTMLEEAGRVSRRDEDLARHLLQIQRYGVEVRALHAEVLGVQVEVRAYFEGLELEAGQRELAAIRRERDRSLVWLDALAGATAGWLSMLGGATATAGGDPKGAISALGGGADIVHTVTRLVVHEAYRAQIDEAFAGIRALRERVEASRAQAVLSKLGALSLKLGGYVTLAGEMRQATAKYMKAKQAALAGFGSAAGAAVGDMSAAAQTSPENPYGGRTQRSKGNIQRLFANLTEYERIAQLLEQADWPEVSGECPLSGFLSAQPAAADVLAQIGIEAGKLRWWKNRMEPLRILVDALRSTVGRIGEYARYAP